MGKRAMWPGSWSPVLALGTLACGCSLDLPTRLPCSTSGGCPPDQVCDVDAVCRPPGELLVCDDASFTAPELVPGSWPPYDDVQLAGISADETVALLGLWGFADDCDDPDVTGCFDIAVATRESKSDPFGVLSVVLAEPEAEVALQLEPDGSGFYYSVFREGTGWDILHGELDGLRLGTITRSPLNTEKDERRIWVDPKDSSAYVMRDWELVYVPDLGRPDTTLSLGLYPSEFTFTSDQLELFFSSDNDSESEDIYYARRSSVDQSFGAPVLLEDLNSDQHDTTPVVPDQAHTVYLHHGATYGDGVPDHPHLARRQCSPP